MLKLVLIDQGSRTDLKLKYDPEGSLCNIFIKDETIEHRGGGWTLPNHMLTEETERAVSFHQLGEELVSGLGNMYFFDQASKMEKLYPRCVNSNNCSFTIEAFSYC